MNICPMCGQDGSHLPWCSKAEVRFDPDWICDACAKGREIKTIGNLTPNVGPCRLCKKVGDHRNYCPDPILELARELHDVILSNEFQNIDTVAENTMKIDEFLRKAVMVERERCAAIAQKVSDDCREWTDCCDEGSLIEKRIRGGK